MWGLNILIIWKGDFDILRYWVLDIFIKIIIKLNRVNLCCVSEGNVVELVG